MGNKNKRSTGPALQERRCGIIHQRDKNRMGRPCMAGLWRYVERSIDIYGERKETKGKTTEKMERQRRNWSGLGTGI